MDKTSLFAENIKDYTQLGVGTITFLSWNNRLKCIFYYISRLIV